MPYKLSENGLCVEKADTGETVEGGCHESHADAVKHLQALEIATHKETQKAMSNLPPIWVRDAPFGSPTQKDNHGQYFDARTNFHDGALNSVPVSYYHNWHPDTGLPIGEPRVIGITTERRKQNPETNIVDGVWDRIEFKDDVPEEIRSRLATAIEKGTLRSSPSVVPDFHQVESNGHIKNWLTGSVAVFDAEGYRQPINRFAIGLPAMKAMYREAGLELPDDLKGTNSMTNVFQEWKQQVSDWFKAAPMPDDTNNETDTDPQKTWDETFGGDPTKGDTDMAQIPDTIRLEWEAKQAQYEKDMTAMKAQVANAQRSVDTTQLGAWFDDLLKAGKVLPAEREQVVAAALQFKSDDDAAMHPNTMKASGGATLSRLDAFKAAVESRQPMLHIDEVRLAQLKAMGFAKPPDADKEVPDTRRQELLKMTDLGNKILEGAAKK